MRSNTVLSALFVSLFCVTVAAVPAIADTLTLTGVGGAQSDGVYIYPYKFTVTANGKSVENVSMSCLNFNRAITMGESWAVDAISIPMGSGSNIDGESPASYRADAWLYNQYNNPNYTATEVQFAIWSIMDPAGVKYTNGFDSKAKELASDALAEANILPASYFANDVLFIPDTSNKSGWGDNGEPQIFIVDPSPIAPTPEPSGLLLFGTGLLGTGLIVQRRQMLSARSTAAN